MVKLSKPVLHRSSCQCQTEPGVNLLNCLGGFCGGVFDKLCFINDLIVKGQILILFDVTAQKIIGSDQDLSRMIWQGIQQFPAFSSCSCYGADRKFRCKMLTFLCPVVYQRRRADDQCIPVVFPLHDIVVI